MVKKLLLIAALICGLISPAFPASMMLTGAGKSGPTLLLDSLSVAPTVAYSTRKLRAAYAGSALQVQRSSDSATQDIGFVGGNLDTAALATFVGANTGLVTIWYDQSGNGINAPAGNGPRIVNAGTLDTLNGNPAIRFGVTSTINNFQSTISISQPNTIAFAAKKNSQVTNGHYTDGLTGSPRQITGISGTSYIQYAGTTVLTGGTVDLLSHALISIFNGASSSTILDGTTLITGNPGTDGIGTQSIGAANGGGGAISFDGWMGEYIVFPSALGASDQGKLRTSWQTQWGTP